MQVDQMPTELIDSHCHFDDGSLEPDREEALARAHRMHVTRQIVPAVAAALWPRLRRVCREHPGLYPAYGLHPVWLAEHRPEDLDTLAQWVEHERPVAIGECGLDYYLEDLDREAQLDYFVAQLRLARDHALPVILHARRCVDDITKHLRRLPGLRGMVHSYSGSEEQAQRLLDLGFYLSFGGPVTYPRAQRLRRLVQTLPLERLLVETDSPDQPGSSHRGERNEPAFLPEVVRTIAELRGIAVHEVAAATTRNAVTLFGLAA